MIFVLQSMCLWLPAIGSFAGGTVSIQFEGFSLTDHDRSSAAADLWKVVTAQLRGEYGDGQIEKMREEFKFAAIDPDTFLVMGPGFYVVKPRLGVFELITPIWHADAIDPPVFRALSARRSVWALSFAPITWRVGRLTSVRCSSDRPALISLK